MGKEKIDGIYVSMFWTNLIFHFTRNNKRTTEKYYFRIQDLLETEKCNKKYSIEVNSARNSFDRMFGIVKAFKKIGIEHLEKIKEVDPQEVTDEEKYLAYVVSLIHCDNYDKKKAIENIVRAYYDLPKCDKKTDDQDNIKMAIRNILGNAANEDYVDKLAQIIVDPRSSIKPEAVETNNQQNKQKAGKK